MRICKKIRCKEFRLLLFYFPSFHFTFFILVFPLKSPFKGKDGKHYIWGGVRTGRLLLLPFLCEGKDSNGFPHIFTLEVFQNFQFLRISQFLHIYLSSAAFNKQKIKEDWADILLVLVCCSSAPIDSQDREVRNCPMIQKEKIEAKRKRKSLQGWQEIDERIY